MAAVGLLVAWLVGRYLNRVTLGRGPEQIAEQFLLAETAMDSLEAGVVVLAPDGRVRLHNDAAARLLGWEDAGEPRLPTELSAALPGAVSGEASLAVGGRVLVVQQRVVRAPGRSDPGGSVPPTALAAAAREGVTTAPAGSRVLVLHDRTDLQRLGDELTVAHTLTTALRAQTHEHANQLHTALALVESGRLEAARAVLSRRAADEEASDDVLAALLTALGNLVDNALDAAAAPDLSAADRWVDVEVVSDAAGLLVQVADGGPGPSDADRGRLFDRGWSTKPVGAAGRGMGLWLTRRIAEEAGGVVDVATDSGTVFTVEVPRDPRPQEET
ncbi:sensor histidine kinase [Micrococcus luteus]|uniref:sensor histidine kinase n=1 Tax=Micrococcus luteus TaxID=1270 RepID=UPI0021535430|nr:ATP-binding protein [Micrococcus luteus]MCV7527780.1 ATP-binding protein [Micrococcus luteus]